VFETTLSSFRAYRSRLAGDYDRSVLARLLVSEEQAPLGHQLSEETMLKIHHGGSRSSRVTVAFEECALVHAVEGRYV
jgi:hypothetical protein